jgi:hypothetical protein
MRQRLAGLGCLTVLLIGLLAEAQTRHRGQVGWASWYGVPYHGRKTASGTRFSMHELTAAHRSLPLGTKALVTSLDTGQQVEVTINDRGPFVDPERRIIDLSRAAAARRAEPWHPTPRLASLSGSPRSAITPSAAASSTAPWLDCWADAARCLAGS